MVVNSKYIVKYQKSRKGKNATGYEKIWTIWQGICLKNDRQLKCNFRFSTGNIKSAQRSACWYLQIVDTSYIIRWSSGTWKLASGLSLVDYGQNKEEDENFDKCKRQM